MTDAVMLDLILRAFRVFSDFGGPACAGLWWRTDGKYAPLTLFVNCSDLFTWATADCEELTADNIAVLEQASSDMQAVTPEDWSQADLLFCCRVRGMRPQQPYYKEFLPAHVPLFDACGPEREE